jgi:antagonist of KipI
MSILVEKSGVLSTIQDLGRTGFRRFGINPNGAMDARAARLINILLGNDETEAILEMHFPAPRILFEEAAIIALGGADFAAKINDESIENWRPYFVDKNQTLNFTKKLAGNRAYLSVKNGFAIEKWLGSASTNLVAEIGGFRGRSLLKDDRLFFNSKLGTQNSKFPYKISRNLIPHYSSFPTIRVIAGAEHTKLTEESKKIFESAIYAVGLNSNRMGFRLNGEKLKLNRKFEMVSTAVAFGTIQLLPDGQIIILMADHQTSGGYPRIAHVAFVDLPVLAQLGAGDKVNFKLISLEEAEDLTLEFEKDLNLLKIALNSTYLLRVNKS